MVKEKLYFLNIDDTHCYPLSNRLNDARLEALQKVTLVEAIPDNENVDYIDEKLPQFRKDGSVINY